MQLTSILSRFFALLTVTANLAVVASIGVVVAGRWSPGGARMRHDIAELARAHGLQLAWLVATVCTLGSLYYSEVANFVPCKLCWYQRIAMYPLAVVLGLAALRRDFGVRRYVLPVVAIGGAISIYHYTIERFPGLAGGTCDPEIPCTVVWVWQFHFISIPYMALSGFALIAALLLMSRGFSGAAAASAPEEGEESDERKLERAQTGH